MCPSQADVHVGAVAPTEVGMELDGAQPLAWQDTGQLLLLT